MQSADFLKNSCSGKLSLEICVDSVQSAIAAEKGGAQRVELCSGLSEGGLTPSAGLIETVRKTIHIGLHVLIRPRRGDFFYSELDFKIMKRDLQLAKELGVDGVVIGILKEDGTIDQERMQELIALSAPLSVTFHRAFDLTADPLLAIDTLIKLKVHRLLSSGQQENALKGVPLLKKLVERTKGQIIIMPGGGITSRNIGAIMEATGAVEFHATARQRVISQMKFFRNNVPMAGGTIVSEYEHLLADPAEIEALGKAISLNRKE